MFPLPVCPEMLGWVVRDTLRDRARRSGGSPSPRSACRNPAGGASSVSTRTRPGGGGRLPAHAQSASLPTLPTLSHACTDMLTVLSTPVHTWGSDNPRCHQAGISRHLHAAGGHLAHRLRSRPTTPGAIRYGTVRLVSAMAECHPRPLMRPRRRASSVRLSVAGVRRARDRALLTRDVPAVRAAPARGRQDPRYDL